LIFTLVDKYRHIIENKKTDSTTCHDKAKTWKQIETEFNARLPNSCRRNSESLKKFYYNKKKELRKSVAEERKEILLTGGGPAKLLKKDASDNLLLSLMGDKTVYGLSNSFDCDNVPSTSHEINHVLQNVTNETTIEFQENYNADIALGVVDITDPNNENTDNEQEFASQQRKQRPLTNKKITSKGKYIKSRRRPTAVVKALTSSDIAAKYKLLIDNRLAIAERDLSWAKEKQSLEKENLLLDIEIKKEKLKQLQNNKNSI
jgi:hypothetical protein